jgi:hypothetical protein
MLLGCRVQIARFLEAVKDDKLRRREKAERKHAERWIMMAARLIAPGAHCWCRHAG